MSEKESIPLWFAYGLPFVLFISGLIAVITRTFWIAGGARGGSSKLDGIPAVYFGAGIMSLGLFFFGFVQVRAQEKDRPVYRWLTWMGGLLVLVFWTVFAIALKNR